MKNYFLYFVIILISCKTKTDIGKPSLVDDKVQKTGNNLDLETVQSPIIKVRLEKLYSREKISLLQVRDGVDSYWMLSPAKELQEGKSYLYKGRLLKLDYFDKELDRKFDTVYLVHNLVETQE
ncbi:MAG TPA: hypothetical protein PLH86_00095 [Saprospiraceae bacterium]|nr:hypothetical protein [Saprospiraceae bacterium]